MVTKPIRFRNMWPALAAIVLVGCGVEGNRRIKTPPPPKKPEEEDQSLTPDDGDETAPYLTPSEQPVLDPDYKKEPIPKAPDYFFFVDGNDYEGRLEKALRVACDRWSRATGVKIQVGRGSDIGVRSGAETEHTVTWWPRSDPPLDGASGRSIRERVLATQIYIAEDMKQASDIGLSNLLTHEMGHSIGRRGDHAESGIMATSFSSFEQTPIDGNSLSYVCEYLLCNHMRPEA